MADTCLPRRSDLLRRERILRAALAPAPGDDALQFRRAMHDEDWTATRQLRHDIYHREIRYVSERDLLDEFDAIAHVINVWRDDQPVATLRLIDSVEREPEMLSTHPWLREHFPAARRYLEVGRYMVRKDFRNRRISLQIFLHVLRHAHACGADSIMMSCAGHLVDYYRKFGFRQVTSRPIARKHLVGVDDYPMVYDLEANPQWLPAVT